MGPRRARPTAWERQGPHSNRPMTRSWWRLAGQIGEALTVVVDAAGELGGFLDELPVDASALESKLARQAELRTLTRKYAADIDGVLRWAQESRQRLAQLDVTEEGLTALAPGSTSSAANWPEAAVDLSNIAAQSRQATRQGGHRGAVRAGDGRRPIHHRRELDRRRAASTADDPAALRCRRASSARAGADGVDQVEFGFAAHRGMDRAAAGQERVRWRAVPRDAGIGGRAGHFP